jgi:hypothetical protein
MWTVNQQRDNNNNNNKMYREVLRSVIVMKMPRMPIDLFCCVRRRGISVESRLQQRAIVVWAKIQAGGSKQGGSRG